MFLKVCCTQNSQEAISCIERQVHMIGFVSAMPTGFRLLKDEQIRQIISQLPQSKTLSVLLSSRTTVSELVDHVNYTGAQAIQIVDEVSPQVLAGVRKLLPNIKILQVIHVIGPEDVAKAISVESLVDYILLDSGKQQGNPKALGGTGLVHDWTISADIVKTLETPIILAGGLTVENAAEAISTVRPAGIDICTGMRDPKFLVLERLDALVSLVNAHL